MTDFRHGYGFDGSRGGISRGFTLIELMVALVVLAILLGIAVPSFQGAALSGRLGAYANDFLASAQLARSEAVKRNAPVRLCVSADGAACDDEGGWEAGWIVVTAAGDVIQRQPPLDTDYSFSEAGDAIVLTFPPTVVGVTPSSFTLCRAAPEGSEERVVTVTASGSASVQRTTEGSCP